ncbi:MAG: DUF2142 domain-containing protein [Thermoleophilaceae bacterium]
MSRIRETFRHIPVAARWCALVAMANALVWSLIVPPFQVPDENAHFAYIQHLAETGEPPRFVAGPGASDAQFQVEIALNEFDVSTRPENRPIWTELEQRNLERVLDSGLSRSNGGGQSNSTNNPPLYHLLGVVAYAAGSWGDLLDRFALLRLVSVLLAGVTVLFTFGFLRELLPRSPLLWTVGGLAVAFQPLFGFMAGGVNNDVLLAATAAALLFGVARALRRGLTPRRAAGIGAALGLGLVSKATLLAFAPALAVAAVVLLRRAVAAERVALLRSIGVAAGVAAVPVLAYVLVNGLIWDRALWSGTAQFSAGTSDAVGSAESSVREQIAYIWQWYLPRMPFMNDQFAGGYYPLYENSFKGFIGRFGWNDYGFTGWVYELAVGVVAVLFGLVGAALWRARAALRRRSGELAVYIIAVLGLAVVIGLPGYTAKESGTGFEQARYYLPLLPLYGAVVALAVRGAGRRAGPAAAAAVVVLAMAHSLFAQLITIARYYG